MRCLYCGNELALLKKLTGGGEFCSDAHRKLYHDEYNRLALSRLLQAQVRTEEGGGAGSLYLASNAVEEPPSEEDVSADDIAAADELYAESFVTDDAGLDEAIDAPPPPSFFNDDPIPLNGHHVELAEDVEPNPETHRPKKAAPDPSGLGGFESGMPAMVVLPADVMRADVTPSWETKPILPERPAAAAEVSEPKMAESYSFRTGLPAKDCAGGPRTSNEKRIEPRDFALRADPKRTDPRTGLRSDGLIGYEAPAVADEVVEEIAIPEVPLPAAEGIPVAEVLPEIAAPVEEAVTAAPVVEPVYQPPARATTPLPGTAPAAIAPSAALKFWSDNGLAEFATADPVFYESTLLAFPTTGLPGQPEAKNKLDGLPRENESPFEDAAPVELAPDAEVESSEPAGVAIAAPPEASVIPEAPPIPEALAVPETQPLVEPEPAPVPQPDPLPEPSPIPEPEPVPHPEPVPQPLTDPLPSPEPVSVPQPMAEIVVEPVIDEPPARTNDFLPPLRAVRPASIPLVKALSPGRGKLASNFPPIPVISFDLNIPLIAALPLRPKMIWGPLAAPARTPEPVIEASAVVEPESPIVPLAVADIAPAIIDPPVVEAPPVAPSVKPAPPKEPLLREVPKTSPPTRPQPAAKVEKPAVKIAEPETPPSKVAAAIDEPPPTAVPTFADDGPKLGFDPQTSGSRFPMPLRIVAGLVLLLGGGLAYYLNSGPAKPTPTPVIPTSIVGDPVNMTQEGWTSDWGADGSNRRTLQISIYRPSLGLNDYRLLFQAQMESKSIGWIFRAANPKKYYAAKLTTTKAGLNPTVELTRYLMIDGEAQDRVQKPLPMPVRLDTLYRVRTDVIGNRYSISVQDKVIDEWTDDRVLSGGVGVFSDKGERAQVQNLQLFHLNSGRR